MRMSAETMLGRLKARGQDDTLGGRIWRARDAVDLSQDALAERMGLPEPLIASWEADRDEPQTRSLFQLAGVLGVSPAWLIAGVGMGPDVPDADISDPDHEAYSEAAAIPALKRDLERLKRQHAALGAAIRVMEERLARLDAPRSQPL
ncbi:helix-turn-helix domain-containing protein [Rhizobium sp. SG2393]|uniref:helix-turn-helix domain-containing protein n=1 Tax=Rhizobium sp. SG2393 TaxID=3276279 RepID=UPI003672181C